MPKRPRLRLWYALGAVALLLVPLVVFQTVAYFHTLRRAEAFLGDVVAIEAERAEQLLADAELQLRRFVDVTRGEVTPEAERLLRQIVYNSPRIREAGIVDARGFLAFTTAKPLAAPIPILSERRVDPDRPTLQVVGRLRTVVMHEESIVLALPTSGQGEVNLLVDPAVLSWFLDDVDLGPKGYLAFVGPTGMLAAIGSPGLTGLDPARAPTADEIRVTRTIHGGEVTLIGALDRARALGDWYDDLRFEIPIAAVCSLLLAWFVIRLLDRRTGLDHDLRLGIRRGELQVEYQPIVDLESGRCVAAEALARWHHPIDGNVRPDVFIPLAEQTGLIEPLTEWLLRRVAQEQAALLERHPGMLLSINCPASLITSRGLEASLTRARLQAGLPPDRVVFELTERVFIEDEGAAREVMSRLRSSGFRFALDDFGSGYSGLSHLQRFDFEYVKIDRAFVGTIGADGVTAAILDSLVDVTHKLGAVAVAEGVETEAQVRHLRRRGVRLAQGWLISASLSLAELEQFLGRPPAPIGEA